MIPPQGQHLHEDFAQANHLRPLHFLDNTGGNREGDPGAGQVSAAEGKTQDGQTSNRHSVLTLKGKSLSNGEAGMRGAAPTLSLAIWALPSLGELRGESKRNAKGGTVVATAEIQSTGLFNLKNWFLHRLLHQLRGLEFNSTSNGFFNIDCMLFSTIQH